MKPTSPARNAPLNVDDLWQLQRISGMAAAPDGRSAVCTVTRWNMDDNSSQAQLWLLRTDGRTAPRRLTSAGRGAAQAAWSPQGDRIAFVARRDQQGHADKTPQLYLLPADGGEASRAARFAPGVEAFRWLPDGRGIVFAAWVWPELRGARAQDQRWQAQADRKETGYATSEAAYRHWDHLHPQDRVPHLLRLDLASGRITDLFEGTAWELPRDSVGLDDFDISPDGRRLAFVHDPATPKTPDNRRAVAEMDLKTRQVRLLADDARWDFDSPRYQPGPGSRVLALRAAQVGHLHTMPARPALVDLAAPGGLAAPARAGGRGRHPEHARPAWRPLGLQWDHEAANLRWAPDGQSLLLTAEQQGRCHLWRCVPGDVHDRQDDGDFSVVTEGGWVQGFDVAEGTLGEVIVTLQDSQAHPARVLAQGGGAPQRRLEHFNDAELKHRTLGRSETLTLPGAQGDPVQVWLTYPPGFDARKRHPVLHVIHGGPFTAAGDSFSFRWNTHVLASQGHVVVQVNFHGSSGFGHAFKHSIMGRLATLEHQDIEATTDWLLRQRWVDPARVYASGGSYGGFMVAWMNGHVPAGRYRAMVCHAGVFDRVATFAADSWASRRKDLGAWYWDDLAAVHAQSPHAHAAGLHTPTLVTHGALDYRVPDCNGLAYYHTLKARGVDARLLWFPDENHWVLKPRNSCQWYGEFHAWLQRHGGPLPGRGRARSPAAGVDSPHSRAVRPKPLGRRGGGA